MYHTPCDNNGAMLIPVWGAVPVRDDVDCDRHADRGNRTRENARLLSQIQVQVYTSFSQKFCHFWFVIIDHHIFIRKQQLPLTDFWSFTNIEHCTNFLKSVRISWELSEFLEICTNFLKIVRISWKVYGFLENCTNFLKSVRISWKLHELLVHFALHFSGQEADWSRGG